MTTFEEGKKYQMTFIGDSNLRPIYVCVKRTPKMVTFKSELTNEVLKRRVKNYSDGEGEYILEGNYSMAPRIAAKRIVKN